jgi:polysaccharide biosynthesis transport protein
MGDASFASGKLFLPVVSVARKRWKLIIAATLIVLAAAIAVSLRQPKRFQATALVEISRQDLAATITGTPSTVATGTDFSRVAQTDATVAQSTAVAEAAIQAARSHLAASALLSSSSVTSSPDNDLLAFAVTSSRSEDAIALANAYAYAYTTFQARLDTASVQRAESGVAAQISLLNRRKAPLPSALTSRESELQVLQALQSSNTTVARPASKAAQIQPRMKRNAVLGLLGGLLIGFSLAFIVDAYDSRITDEREIVNRLGWPLLARVPEMSKKARAANSVASLDEPLEPMAEAFRILRAQLRYSLTINPARVVGVTSALTSEGKSTTSANLAVALARAGSRVILLELDLRRPTLGRLFALDRNRPGLCDVIFADDSVDEALQAIDLGGAAGQIPMPSRSVEAGSLRVMVAGPPPPNVGELMASDLISPIIQQLRSESDIVVVDVPPLLGIGDVRALADDLDALLVVSRIGIARRGTLDDLREAASTMPLKVLGVAITGGDHARGYGYGYGYRHSGRGASNGRVNNKVASPVA